MKYALDPLNVAIIKLLETDNQIQYDGDNVTVYTEVANDSQFPLIVVEPSTSAENDVTRDSIGQTYVMNVEVISKFKQGEGGWGANSNIVNQITELIRVKGTYLDLSANNLKVKRQSIQSIQPLREAYKDGVYFRSIIIIEFDIEETA